MPGYVKKMLQFWQELKRRNVHRSLAIYAGTAFIILEAADLIFPRWGFPDWSIDIVLYLLILGAVITIIVSWVYDLTPGGVEKTKSINEVKSGEKQVVANGWKVATYVSIAVVVGLIIFNLVGGLSRVQKGSIQSLMLLPFDNFTGDEKLEYFVSGMHSSLIGEMGKIKGLRIISQRTSNTYKDNEKSVPEIASELKVEALLESNVMCLGDSICVQFKLIGAFPEENLLWSNTYESEMGNILNLYNRVILDIMNEIQLTLSPDQLAQLAIKKPVNPEAYKFYLNGKFHMGFLTKESLQTALDYFVKATEADPEYAPPYGGLAGVWGFLKQMDYVSPDEATPKMEEYLTRAIQLDAHNAEVYYYDGIKKIWSDFNWEAGEKSLIACLEINPNFAEARAYYSHLMMLLKRPNEMREQMKLALENDPKNPLIQVLATVELMVESKNEECITKARQLQAMMPNNPLLMLVLFQCFTETGEHELAIVELKKVFSQIADEKLVNILGETYSKEGFKKALHTAADEWVERPDFASAQHAIMLYAYAGNADKALYWLEKAYIRRDPANPYIGVIPNLRPYHQEPRYIEIMQRMNLPLGDFQ
jgi:TolB-like protein